MKRCETCKHWKIEDGEEMIGVCRELSAEEEAVTFAEEGTDCEVYSASETSSVTSSPALSAAYTNG